MNPDQINAGILEALGVPMKNCCGAYLVLAAGEYPRLTVQYMLLDGEMLEGMKTKFVKYKLTVHELSSPLPHSSNAGQ